MARSSQTGGTQRVASIVVGAGVLALAGYLTLETGGARAKKSADVPVAPPVASAAPAAADAGPPVEAVELDAGLYLPTLSIGDAGLVLPSGAPRSVKIGVILVTFAGAEGAPPSARSKKDAQALAERLEGEAQSDFHRAVGGGDPGSAGDIGRLPRGVLDPRTEVAVFGLASGEVSQVLETPRGFWIVKRID